MSNYLNLVPDRFKEEFAQFVKTGNGSFEFLNELVKNQDMLRAADLAFWEQIDAL